MFPNQRNWDIFQIQKFKKILNEKFSKNFSQKKNRKFFNFFFWNFRNLKKTKKKKSKIFEKKKFQIFSKNIEKNLKNFHKKKFQIFENFSNLFTIFLKIFWTLELGMRLRQCISGARKDTRKSLQSWKLKFRTIQICYFLKIAISGTFETCNMEKNKGKKRILPKT